MKDFFYGILALVFSLSSPNVLAWTQSTLESNGPTSGETICLAVESTTGYAHIVYFNNNTYYASSNRNKPQYVTNETGSWSVPVNASSNIYSGTDIGCAVDSSGFVHATHLNWSNSDLYYSTNSSTGSWSTTTVDAATNNAHSAMTIDSSDVRYVAYYDGNNLDLKYVDSTSWGGYTTVDSGGSVGLNPSIAVDSQGYIHIVYDDSTNSDLKHATDATGIWVTETIDTDGDSGNYQAIAIDEDDTLHVSYLSNPSVSTGTGLHHNLKYAIKASSATSWTKTVIDSTENNYYETSITVTSPTAVHISYYDETNSILKYATNITGSWLTHTVDSSNSGRYSSIDSDDSGNISIAYVDHVNNDIEFAYNTCGDGTVDVSEECDDDNETDEDGCSSACETEVLCGNGNVNTGEACDDGNTVSGDGCSADCSKVEVCGDGTVDSGEACDDGDTSNNNDCLNTCVVASCPDSYIWNAGTAMETCDDGDYSSMDACPNNCKTAVCGDGHIWNTESGTETCDDGNTVDADGCSATCLIEHPPVADAGPPTLSVPYGAGACGPTCTKFFLDGRYSTDPDLDPITYLWTGTRGAIVSPTLARTAVRVNMKGSFVFTLTVTDSDGDTSTDTITVTVY